MVAESLVDGRLEKACKESESLASLSRGGSREGRRNGTGSTGSVLPAPPAVESSPSAMSKAREDDAAPMEKPRLRRRKALSMASMAPGPDDAVRGGCMTRMGL